MHLHHAPASKRWALARCSYNHVNNETLTQAATQPTLPMSHFVTQQAVSRRYMVFSNGNYENKQIVSYI